MTDNWYDICVTSKTIHNYQLYPTLRRWKNLKTNNSTSIANQEYFYRAHSVIEEKTISTELTRSSKRSQFSPSSLGHQRKDGEVSFYRAHSVIEENMVKSVSPSSLGHHRKLSAYRVHPATEGFYRILCINRAQSVNTGIIFFEQNLPCRVGQ